LQSPGSKDADAMQGLRESPIITNPEAEASSPLPDRDNDRHSTSIELMSTPEISDEFNSVPGLSPSASAQEPPTTPLIANNSLEPSNTPPQYARAVSSNAGDLVIIKSEPEVLPSIDAALSGDLASRERASSAYHLTSPRDEHSATPFLCKTGFPLKEAQAYELPVLAREGSGHTDISSELGDLRIQTTYGDPRNPLRRVSESSPESSPGADLLSPYLDHSNKLPRLRKFYQQR